MPKVLYVCHGHPAVRPGGVETYTLELYEAMRQAGEFEPLLLARLAHRESAPAITSSAADPNQYFIHTSSAGYDAFFGTSPDKRLFTTHFHEFLALHKPDVVHFQHTLFLGYDLIRQTRNSLPSVPIVYTLQEFVPMCHNNGQMVRTADGARCSESTPVRCHECFPDIPPQAFFQRKRFIQSQLELVSMFFAPSRFLRDRYIQWGIPEHRIRVEDYGRQASAPVHGQEPHAPRVPRNRFGFFGQLSAFKGVDVLLDAMRLLQEDQPDGAAAAYRPRLSVHGANLEWQPKVFQHEFRTLLDRTAETVTFSGSYAQSDLPRLMANVDWVVVPSVWWENSPLVIQEAFLHGRPVICSDIGGMAEKVTDGVNGLWFRAGDARSLAETLTRAARSPELWETLRQGLPAVYPMADHVRTLTVTYRTLMNATVGA